MGTLEFSVSNAGVHLVGTYNSTSNSTNWEALIHGVIEIEDIALSVIYDTSSSSFYGMLLLCILNVVCANCVLGNLTYGEPTALVYAAMQVIYQPQDCNANGSSPAFTGSGQLSLSPGESSITVDALVSFDKCNSKWDISAIENSKSWELDGLELNSLNISLSGGKVLANIDVK